MGWVSNFLSKAVMAGFVLGFSIGIIIDQSHKLLGVPRRRGSYVAGALIETIKEIPDTNRDHLVVGATRWSLLLLMRRYLAEVAACADRHGAVHRGGRARSTWPTTASP